MQISMHNYKDIRAMAQLIKQAQIFGLTTQQFQDYWESFQPKVKPEIISKKLDVHLNLFKTLEESTERIILQCPWVRIEVIDDSFILRLKGALDKGVQVDFGWGYQDDIGTNIKRVRNGEFLFSHRYSAMQKLFQLKNLYPALLRLKLTGSHSKYFVCDQKLVYVGSQNFLSSYSDHKGDETGIVHRDLEIIQKIVANYDKLADLTNSV